MQIPVSIYCLSRMTHKIIYYKSALCPRCLSTDRRLSELRTAQPEIEIETIKILTHPARTLYDGVWMIPTIIIGDRRWHHAPSLSELNAALHEEE
jgi:hypothetical protein